MAVYIIGGGLAGCEAAWQIVKRGTDVCMLEMKPAEFTPAHRMPLLCELVCSNSFKSDDLQTASGLLKEEMRRMDSLVLACADRTRVPAGGALAVDRELFAAAVTRRLQEHPHFHLVTRRVDSLRALAAEPNCQAIVTATGPLTADALAEDTGRILGTDRLSFFDAAAPLVYENSINPDHAFRAARYGKGSDDYINCPMNRQEYEAFYDALVHAACAEVKDFDNLEGQVYEGCMPIEVMARRGADTLRFGPLKPVGLRHPVTREAFYAVVQLRQDNAEGTLYNMVGFQTRLKFGEQKRVFGMIPALVDAEYARYGVMHRNTYLRSPGILDETYRADPARVRTDVPLFFAGQMTGVEGYIESASSGLLAGINAWAAITGRAAFRLPRSTMSGALAGYVSGYGGGDFQPMGANFGIMMVELTEEQMRVRDKKLKKRLISAHALDILETVIKNQNWE